MVYMISRFDGKMSDFRIYATALSEEDIADLYHIPANIDNLGGIHGFEFVEKETANLQDFSYPWVYENLTGTIIYDNNVGECLQLTTSSTNQRAYKNVSSTLWQNGKIYTVSFLAKSSVNGTTCNMSRSIADFSENFTLTTEWQKYTGTIASTATPNGGTLSFRIIPSGVTVYLANVKIEEANQNLISIKKEGIINENNIDEISFNNNAKFLKNSSNIIGNIFIEK